MVGTVFFFFFFEGICSSDIQKCLIFSLAKPISTKRFPFYPYIKCLYKVVKKSTVYLWLLSGLNLVGSWYQVATNNVPLKGSTHRGVGVEGEWVMLAPTSHHATSQKQLGQFSTNLVGRVTAPEVFCMCQIRAATAHAYNTLFLCLGKHRGS